MSRYRGPRLKKCRALGCDLPGLTRKSIERRPYPPGIAGPTRARSKKSVFGMQLMEKQKLRFNYLVSETYLRIMVRRAQRAKEQTSIKLIELLESRIDNVVFRSGLAPTIPAARQLVSHKHILINGRRIRTASLRVKIGDVITIGPKAETIPLVVDSWSNPSMLRPDWLDCDLDHMITKVTALPSPDEIGFPVNLGSIVEYYSRRVS